jgi:hypothetical protein
MRLLKLNDSGKPSLVERSGNDIPAYAILSHTWGSDGKEVTYKDLLEGISESKTGYGKIRFCAKQAQADSLDYF